MIKSHFGDKLSILKTVTTENVKSYRKHHEKHRDKLYNKYQHLGRKDNGKTADKEIHV